jgi:hypothetical protein
MSLLRHQQERNSRKLENFTAKQKKPGKAEE